MATNVIFTRGNTATINATAITDGQILYNTTAGTQYLDNGTTRIQVGQNITVDTTLNSLSSNPIANSGVAGVMYTSLTDIAAITQSGNLPDALAVKALNSNLTANSIPFYYDYQNSKYGYNTSANRGADTFHPFSGYEDLGVGTSFNVSTHSGYQNLTSANFICECSTTTIGSIIKSWSTDTTGNFSFTSQFAKSYDNSTGMLSASLNFYGNYNILNIEQGSPNSVVPVHCYLIQ